MCTVKFGRILPKKITVHILHNIRRENSREFQEKNCLVIFKTYFFPLGKKMILNKIKMFFIKI